MKKEMRIAEDTARNTIFRNVPSLTTLKLFFKEHSHWPCGYMISEKPVDRDLWYAAENGALEDRCGYNASFSLGSQMYALSGSNTSTKMFGGEYPFHTGCYPDFPWWAGEAFEGSSRQRAKVSAIELSIEADNMEDIYIFRHCRGFLGLGYTQPCKAGETEVQIEYTPKAEVKTLAAEGIKVLDVGYTYDSGVFRVSVTPSLLKGKEKEILYHF